MGMVNGGKSIKFNGTELQTDKRGITQITPYGGLGKTLSILPMARSNKSKSTGSFNQQRTIPYEGWIKGDDMNDLIDEVDGFNTLVEGRGTLDIDLDGNDNYRRWYVEAAQVNWDDQVSLLQQDFSSSFVCVKPFGYDLTATTLVNSSAVTSAPATATPTFGGSAPLQKPVITITINSFTGEATNTVSVENTDTGQKISITYTYTNGDVIIIDPDNASVTINGDEVDYSGALVNFGWAPGGANIKFDNDFATQNVDYLVQNTNQYK
jgi:phage-related protein